MKKIFLAFVSLFLVGAVWAGMLDDSGDSSLEDTAFDTSEGAQQSEPLDLQSSGSFTAESYNRMVELVSDRTGVSDATGASSLNGTALDSESSIQDSSPLVLKNHGDILTAEEYNRLLEMLAQGGQCPVKNNTHYEIQNCPEFQNLGNDALCEGTLSDTYYIMNDFSCGSFGNFEPIGGPSTPFRGTLYGQGYTVSDITIDHPGRSEYTGIFSNLMTANISDLTIDNADVDGQQYVGVLAGTANSSSGSETGGEIFNVHVKNSSIGGSEAYVGGLLGAAHNGSLIRQVSTEGTVIGKEYAAGLVGVMLSGAEIRQSYSGADVTATDTIPGVNGAAGLVALTQGAIISDSYATGTITSDTGHAGGAVSGVIRPDPTTVTNVYSIGQVNGVSPSGGLVYSASPPFDSVSNSFYDTETSGRNDNNGRGVPLTTAEMNQESTFTGAGWDFGSTWQIDEGNTYPCLQWQGDTSQCPTANSAPGTCANGGTPITTCDELFGMADLTADYCLAKDITCSGTYTPIGEQPFQYFTGDFDGEGNEIIDLNIAGDSVGLFRALSGATVNNIIFRNPVLNIQSYRGDGGIVGVLAQHGTNISGVFVLNPTFQCDTYCNKVGGIIGIGRGVNITDVHVDENGSIDAYMAGGLIGRAVGDTNSATDDTVVIRNSSSKMNIQGQFAGGLVGEMEKLRIHIYESFATGAITGSKSYGVLSKNSYTRGGGLLGRVQNGDTVIHDNYFVGNISGFSSTGGIVGWLDSNTSLKNNYTATESDMFLVGVAGSGYDSQNGNLSHQPANCSIVDNYYQDSDAIVSSGKIERLFGDVLTKSQMNQRESFSGFNFTKWQIDEGNTYPCLRWQGDTDQCPSNN